MARYRPYGWRTSGPWTFALDANMPDSPIRRRTRVTHPINNVATSMKTWLTNAALLSLATCTPLVAAPPLPAEHLTATTLSPGNPHWIYVLDEAFNNEIDAR